ncbi:MAG: heparan-alpha-glucosaminide N-acetyltransferase domain-containing protein [Mucilaginibacter sp.]
MSTLTMSRPVTRALPPSPVKPKRIKSIDLLRGTIMIIMAIDHVRDYFHKEAFLYSPTDLSKTSIVLFLTRLITHFCAPIFIFLAGVSAFLYGAKRSKKELSFFLLTRGIWLVFVELFILVFFHTFNPMYTHFNLQVIWAIGVCMIVLSALIYLDRRLILFISILLIAGHNLLDGIHVPGGGLGSFLWALVHDPGGFTFGHTTVSVVYPVLPWIGVILLGYCFGALFTNDYDPARRQRNLFYLGVASLILFVALRAGNFYGDAAHWSVQKNFAFSMLSFLNVTKYPPSLLYILLTLGVALLFLSVAEKPLNAITSKITVFGRVPMFYYLAHILLIHLLAVVGAVLSGYKWSVMVLHTRVNSSPELKGYGFSLLTVYMVWVLLIVTLCPLCKWFDNYKRTNQSKYWWLSYL